MPPGKVRFPFGPCKICKDSATGVHYGVSTCEGCKGFFKRSIAKADKYKCYFGRECDLNPKNRNRCKFCRYHLCLKNGMSVEAVKMGRIPKVEKEKALAACESSDLGTILRDDQMTALDDMSEYRQADQPKISLDICQPDSDAAKYNGDSGNSMATDSAGRVANAFTFPSSYNSHNKVTVGTGSSVHRKTHVSQQNVGPGLVNVNMDMAPTPTLGNKLLSHSNDNNSCNSLNFKRSRFTENHGMSIADSGYSDHIDYSDTLFKASSVYDSPALSNIESNCPTIANVNSEKPEVTTLLRNYQQLQQQSSTFPSQHNNVNESEITSFNADNRAIIPSQMAPVYNHVNISYSGPGFHDYSSAPSANLSYKCTSFPASSTVPYDRQKFLTRSAIPVHDGKLLNNGRTLEEAFPRPIVPLVPPHTNKDDSITDMHNQKLNVTQATNTFAQHHNTNFPAVTSMVGKTNNQFSHTGGNHNSVVNYVNTSEEIKQNGSFESQMRNVNDFEMKMKPIKLFDNAHGDMKTIRDLDNPTNSEVMANEYFKPSGHIGNTAYQMKCLESTPSQTQLPLFQVRATTCPSPCATASSISMCSTSSSNRSRYSPGLIRILLEQVLDMKKKKDIAEKLKLQLQQNKTEPTVIAEILNLVGEVIKKRNSVTQSETESSSSAFSNLSFARLADNKRERIQSFLNDVEMYSINRSFTLKLQDSEDIQALNNGNRKTNEMKLKLEENSDSGLVDGFTGSFQQSSMANTQTESLSLEHALEIRSIDTGRNTLNDNEIADNNKVLQCNRDRLKLAMRILCRLYPEHREKLRLWKSGQIQLRVMTDSDEDVKETFQKVVAGIPMLSERIMGFCQAVPGFSELSVHDRGVLMKRAYYDIWMLLSSEYFSNGEVNLILQSGEIYSRQTMTKILNEEMVHLLLSFAEEFNALWLTDLEISVLCAIQLMLTDDLQLENKPAADKLHSLMIDVLTVEVRHNHPGNYKQLLIDIFQILPALDRINKMQMQIIAEFQLDKFDD